MATVTTNKSPLHIKSTVGYPFGVSDSGYSCGYHTGTDFPESGTNEKNPDLFSVVEDGEVVYIYKDSTGTSPALGNQVQIKDNKTGNFYRYCHMLYGSISVKVGDKVNLLTKLGKMRKHRKFYWNSFTFRAFDNKRLDLWKFFKSCRTFRNSKYTRNYCGIHRRHSARTRTTT